MLKRVGTVSDDALWADIIEEGKKPDPVKPGEKSLVDLAALWRRDIRESQRIADGLVHQKRMVKRRAEMPNSRTAWVYMPVKK